ncbi:MAG: lamin tail domain-containing protein, partial [Bacteroidetes bacterium]|nr:lamin tail domain-containing protein [Bacteroidota bacterium]
MRKLIQCLFILSFLSLSKESYSQIVLNELYIKPRGNVNMPTAGWNGLIYTGSEEYIELYNKGCSPVNVAGYFVAMKQKFGASVIGGTLRIPNTPAAIIPPGGHLVLGSASPPNPSILQGNVDITFASAAGDFCTYPSGTSGNPSNIAQPNADGWVALYNTTGAPLDCVYWSGAANNINANPDDFNSGPICLPTATPSSPAVTLPDAKDIYDTKRCLVSYIPVSNPVIVYRQTDGALNWQFVSTYNAATLPSTINKSTASGRCNGGTCITPAQTPPQAGTITNSTTCAGTGSVVLNGLPGNIPNNVAPCSDWTITRSPGGTTTTGNTLTTTISNLPPGAYTFTVTNSGGCVSAATNVPITGPTNCCPVTPTITPTPASCTAAGSSKIGNYDASYSYTFSPLGPTVGAGGAISGMSVGTNYTVTATANGCTSPASASFSNAAQLTTPAVPAVTTTPATCLAASISTITNYNASLTYTFTPSGPTVTGSGVINNMTAGTPYTVTARNANCTSAASVSFQRTNQLTTPAVPTISSVPPTCTAAGTSSISNYNSTNIYTFSPAGPSVGVGGVISGMTVGQNYQVTAGLTGCTSAASTPFSNAAQLLTLTPTVTCVSSTTSSVTFGWNAVTGATGYNVRYQVNGGAFTAIQNITTNSFTTGSTPVIGSGDNVRIEVTPTGAPGTCFSVGTRTCPAIACPSISAGLITGGDKVCVGSTLALSNTTATLAGGPATGTWSSSDLAIATIDAAGVVTPVAPGTATISYTVTSNTTGCPPAIETQTVTVNANPVAPTGTKVEPTCNTPTGTITITAPTGSNLEYTLNGGTPQSGTSFNGLAPNTYNIIARNTATGCVSPAGSFVLNTPPGAPNPGTISGNASICIGGTTTLSSIGGDPGGSWTSLNPNIASVDASGVVTGVAA